MFRLQVKLHFDSAHFLKDYDGKCANMHGHRWEVEACVQGTQMDLKHNMLIDFGIVKKAMNKLIDQFDHHVLNEVLDCENPTAEYLAKWFFDNLKEGLGEYGPMLARTCVWESPDCCVKYYDKR